MGWRIWLLFGLSSLVVIFPKELSHLEQVLISANPNIDPEDGHPIAYQRVLAAAAEYEIPPIFLKEDCQAIVTDPVKAEVVPKYMCLAEQIATGSRPRVLEDGPDTIHSDEDAEEDVEADKELGMYAPGVDPTLGPVKLTRAEVARQLAAAHAIKAQASDTQSSCSESDNPDGLDMRYSHSRKTFVKNAAKDLSDSEIGNSIISSPSSSTAPTRPPTPSVERQRLVEGAKKRVAVPRSPSAENLAKGKPATRSRAVADPQTGSKASPGTAETTQPKGAQAPSPTKGQQVPKHPMETREREGSRAGGFRPGVGGSGQKDTCVASSHPSQT
jgi:hypothetical protein